MTFECFMSHNYMRHLIRFYITDKPRRQLPLFKEKHMVLLSDNFNTLKSAKNRIKM